MAVFPRDNRSGAAFDRTIEFSRINFELVGYAALVLASILAHLWALGHMAMHHDESIHAWMSSKFFTGAGGFTCAGGRSSATYCYDPVYHGPSLYVLTLISYFLFGVGEAQARLPQALAGIALVASCWMLRPLIGRRSAFLAGVILAFAPSILYYTRFARHDGLMLLWTFWIVAGFFRFLHDGRARWLYLLAAAAALAVATHEMWYILVFLFGFYLIARLLSEFLPRRAAAIALTACLAVSIATELVGLVVTLPKSLSGIALLVATVSLLSLILLRVSDSRSLLVERFVALWREQRSAVWVALAIFGALYVLLYSTFFTNPIGIVDGLFQGIGYWLGSQQEYARGKQPWYYYLILMPLYEPLAFFGGISVALALFVGPSALARVTPLFAPPLEVRDTPIDTPDASEPADSLVQDSWRDRTFDGATPDANSIVKNLFPLFLVFWFLSSLVAFSWAGEKMPWLVTHIALPGNLLIAWGIGELLRRIRWRELPAGVAALVPATIVLLIIALSVMVWRFTPSGNEGLEAQAWLLAGIIPLLVAGGLIYALLTLTQRLGWRPTLMLAVLTVSALLGAYMIRASWMVVYDHPDTPREILIYTQSSPDVPLIVRDLKELAINQTRNSRTTNDPTGGLSMPVIMDIGETSSGDGSLAWPFQWYLRDFQRIESRNADFFTAATAASFDVKLPDGSTGPAPAVLVYTPHVTQATKQALEAQYVKRYDAKLNWWFPEGDLSGCNPATPGYKQFFYSTLTINQAKADPQCVGIDFNTAQYQGPLAPIAWLFDRQHWPDTFRFIVWRDLPEPLRLDGREMQMWVRKDLAVGASSSTANAAPSLRLLAEQTIGAAGTAEGQLTQPRGVAVDSKGNVFVTDTGNNRVEVYSADGSFVRSIGSFGAGDGQFNEPRGIAVDGQDNLYVADTWNARIAKFDANGNFIKAWGEGKQQMENGRKATMTDRSAAGNTANPLGFFGPRGVAVDNQGNVFIADTGNRRIVVTDSEGKFRYQWGYEGAGPGQFSEPVGVAVDGFGNVYVADYWNGRVQVFSKDTVAPNVNAQPSATWAITGWQANTYDDPYIAVASDGTIYLTIPGSNQVQAYNASGQPLITWGAKGSDAASVELPSGIATGPAGSVFVTDRGNARVLRYKVPAVAPVTP